MLFFIDESGHPHPHDDTARPSLSAVGVRLGSLRKLGGALHALKKDILGDEDPHHEDKYKANRLLNERTYNRVREKWEYVEAVLDLAANFPVVSFHVVMQRPERPLLTSAEVIPYHVRCLLGRVQEFMSTECPGDVAVPVFDSQDHTTDLRLSMAIECFLYRHAEGRRWTSMLPSPLFVDSKTMVGIQLADLFVSCVRQYHEITDGDVKRSSSYARAIERLHNQVARTVWDHSDGDGRLWHGEYVMGSWRDDALVSPTDGD